jgi:hypothetical protein
MKIYIAGKITGDANYKNKFNAAEQKLLRDGHIVLNPAVWTDGMTREEYMTMDLAMLRVADAAYFLKDYEESAGAMLEHHYCEYVNKAIIYA